MDPNKPGKRQEVLLPTVDQCINTHVKPKTSVKGEVKTEQLLETYNWQGSHFLNGKDSTANQITYSLNAHSSCEALSLPTNEMNTVPTTLQIIDGNLQVIQTHNSEKLPTVNKTTPQFNQCIDQEPNSENRSQDDYVSITHVAPDHQMLSDVVENENGILYHTSSADQNTSGNRKFPHDIGEESPDDFLNDLTKQKYKRHKRKKRFSFATKFKKEGGNKIRKQKMPRKQKKPTKSGINSVETPVLDGLSSEQMESIECTVSLVEGDNLDEANKKKAKRKLSDWKAEGIDPTKLEDNVDQVRLRMEKGCECIDDNCFSNMDPEMVFKHRYNIADLTKHEHYMYMMGLQMACLSDREHTMRNKERKYQRCQYACFGRKVCLESFLYLQNMTRYAMKSIRKHLLTHGVRPRVHGNQGRKPHNTFGTEIFEHATAFLQSYIERNYSAHQSPAKTKKGRPAPIYLPAEVTLKKIHTAYREYCEHFEPDIKVMGYSTFKHFLKKEFPHLKFYTKVEGKPPVVEQPRNINNTEPPAQPQWQAFGYREEKDQTNKPTQVQKEGPVTIVNPQQIVSSVGIHGHSADDGNVVALQQQPVQTLQTGIPILLTVTSCQSSLAATVTTTQSKTTHATAQMPIYGYMNTDNTTVIPIIQLQTSSVGVPNNIGQTAAVGLTQDGTTVPVHYTNQNDTVITNQNQSTLQWLN